VFKAQLCSVGFEYLEDLEFDEKFELSLFETKSESVVASTTLNVEFVINLETKSANKYIDDYILNQLQTSIVASNIADFLETASATLGSSAIASSSRIPTKPPFIPTIPVQPTVSDKKSTVVSPPSTPSTPKTSKIASPLHTHPHTPHISATPTPPTSLTPIANPPRAMAAHFAPLVLPQNLDDVPTDYQRKIPFFMPLLIVLQLSNMWTE